MDDLPPTPPEVSVLVVGYKSIGYIARCLEGAIRSAGNEPFEFLFIDCSNDGSEAFVRERFPSVKVLPYQGNLGFARGNNVLAAIAKSRRLLLLNPDAFAERDELAALLAVARARPDAAAWGAINILPSGDFDGGSMQPMLGALPLAFAILGLASLRPGTASTTRLELQEVPVLSGAFMMIDAAVWKQLGGFDERFFMNSEEVDLQRRARSNGLPSVIIGNIAVVHSGGGSSDQQRRLLWLTQGEWRYFDKWSGAGRARMFKVALLAACLCNLVWNAARSLVGRDVHPVQKFRSSYVVIRDASHR